VKLETLLRQVETKSVIGRLDREVFGIESDHRKLNAGFAWICYKGVKIDAHQFIPSALAAISNRPTAIIAEATATGVPGNLTYVQVANGRSALAQIAANWYCRPAEDLDLIGITGTNGKTSTAYFIESVFQAAQLNPAVIGTIGYRYGKVSLPSQTTTPDPLLLYRLLADIRQQKLQYVIMEASSQGLAQHRLDYLKFQVGVFTNLTQDHLDYHPSIEHYLQAKLRLFEQIDSSGVAVINTDLPVKITDRIGTTSTAPAITYGFNGHPDVTATNILPTSSGLTFQLSLGVGNIRTSLQRQIEIRLKLLGNYNIYNALAAASVGLHYQIDLETIKTGLETTVIPGRFESVDLGLPFMVIVDYAHTPDGLQNLLETAREATDRRLVVVFGCGGNRDAVKRPIMGEIATKTADYTILTSDNPRSEDPEQIIRQIMVGIHSTGVSGKYEMIVDRKAAIGRAIEIAKAGDLVVIAGKGHETYQEVEGVRLPFDDRQVAAEYVGYTYSPSLARGEEGKPT